MGAALVETMEHDTIMGRINAAVALDYSGNREEARARLEELWEDVEMDGQALPQCTLAHYMADMQDDPHQELLWDLRALEAAGSLAGDEARDYYPSLHLNLAEDYRKLGDWDTAREHLARARELVGALPDNGYGNMIRRGIEDLAGLPEFTGC